MSTEVKTYSLQEVAEHNEKKSVWIVVHDNVYDVTPFLDEVSWALFRLSTIVSYLFSSILAVKRFLLNKVAKMQQNPLRMLVTQPMLVIWWPNIW